MIKLLSVRHQFIMHGNLKIDDFIVEFVNENLMAYQGYLRNT